MGKALLIAAGLIVVFILCFFPIRKLDNFLDESRRSAEKESEKKEPACVMLADDMSEQDIIKEIRRFKDQHGEIGILIFDPSDTQLSEAIDKQINDKTQK
ncbi:MAG: hypothetical protein PUB94_06665 [Oscillospiraceae bacterium]|nr:hypothetical protein [Oscillospiraceae bacterium]